MDKKIKAISQAFQGQPPDDDHENALMQLVPPKEGYACSSSYNTLTTILQFHVKRLWISGVLETAEDLYREISRISPRVQFDDVKRFLEDNITSDDWLKSREVFLEKKLQLELDDKARVATRIDEIYDLEFDKARGLLSRELDAMQNSEEELDVRAMQKIVATLKVTYESQRLARGMVQGIQGTVKQDDLEGQTFRERLKKVEEVINAKTIDIETLEPK